MQITRFSIHDLPGAALHSIANVPASTAIILHSMVDSKGDSEALVAADTAFTDINGHVARVDGLLRLDDPEVTCPTSMLLMTVTTLLKQSALPAIIAPFQRSLLLNANSAWYSRDTSNEAGIFEKAMLVFDASDAAKVQALTERLLVQGHIARIHSAHTLGSTHHAPWVIPPVASDRYLVSASPAPGVIADLQWHAAKNGVNLLETRSIESEYGASVILGFDGSPRARGDYTGFLRERFKAPIPYVAQQAVETSSGHLWVEASGPVGTVLSVTSRARQHSFTHLQTRREKSSEFLQGLLRIRHRSPWQVGRQLRAWSSTRRFDLTTHVVEGGALHTQDEVGDH